MTPSPYCLLTTHDNMLRIIAHDRLGAAFRSSYIYAFLLSCECIIVSHSSSMCFVLSQLWQECEHPEQPAHPPKAFCLMRYLIAPTTASKTSIATIIVPIYAHSPFAFLTDSTEACVEGLGRNSANRNKAIKRAATNVPAPRAVSPVKSPPI